MRIVKILLIAASILLLSCGREELDSLPVYFISGGQVYSIDFDGGNLKRLTNDANTYESVSSSLDGEDILLSDSSGKMYLMNYKGGTPVYFMDGKNGTYGPSGNIYFAVKSGSYHNIMAKCSPDGSNVFHLKTMLSTTDILSLSCSMDETELAIHYWQSGPTYSAKMDLSTLSDPVTIANGGVKQAYFPLNNDLLAYADTTLRIIHSDATYNDIYSFAYGTISTAPALSPDGQYIFFCNNAPDPKEIKRLKIDTSEEVILGYINTSVSAFCVLGKPR